MAEGRCPLHGLSSSETPQTFWSGIVEIKPQNTSPTDENAGDDCKHFDHNNSAVIKTEPSDNDENRCAIHGKLPDIDQQNGENKIELQMDTSPANTVLCDSTNIHADPPKCAVHNEVSVPVSRVEASVPFGFSHPHQTWSQAAPDLTETCVKHSGIYACVKHESDTHDTETKPHALVGSPCIEHKDITGQTGASISSASDVPSSLANRQEFPAESERSTVLTTPVSTSNDEETAGNTNCQVTQNKKPEKPLHTLWPEESRVAAQQCTSQDDLPDDIKQKNSLEKLKAKHRVSCRFCKNVFAWKEVKKHLESSHRTEWHAVLNRVIDKTLTRKVPEFRCDLCDGKYKELPAKIRHYAKSHPGVTNHHCNHKLVTFLEHMKNEPCNNQFDIVKLLRKHNASDHTVNPRDNDLKYVVCPVCTAVTANIRTHMSSHVSMLLSNKVNGIYYCTYCFLMCTTLHLAARHWDFMHRLDSLRAKQSGSAEEDVSHTIPSSSIVKRNAPGIEEKFQAEHEQMIDNWEVLLKFFIGPHLCHDCGRNFPSDNGLKKHKSYADCQRDPVVACDECPADFQSQCELRQHVRQEHASDATHKILLTGAASTSMTTICPLVDQGEDSRVLESYSAAGKANIAGENMQTVPGDEKESAYSGDSKILHRKYQSALENCISRDDLPAHIRKKNQAKVDKTNLWVRCSFCEEYIMWTDGKKHMIARHRSAWMLAVSNASSKLPQKPIQQKTHFCCVECDGTRMSNLPEKIKHYETNHPEVTSHHCRHTLATFLEQMEQNPCNNEFQLMRLMLRFNRTDYRKTKSKATKTRQEKAARAPRYPFVSCPICTNQIADIRAHMARHKSTLREVKDSIAYLCTYCHRKFCNSQGAVHHWVNKHRISRSEQPTSQNTGPANQEDPDLEVTFLEEHKEMLDGWEVILKLFKSPHTCGDCGQSFSGGQELESHKASRSCLNDPFFPCNECSKICETYSDLEKHMFKKHVYVSDERVQCTICDKTFARRYLSKHMSLAHRKTPISCKHCDEIFDSPRAQKTHMVEVHSAPCQNRKAYVCEICGRSFSTKFLIDGHMNKHKGETIKCSYCDATFTHPFSKYRHEQSTHKGKEKVKCPQCPATFVQRASLNRHLKTHMKIRYACDICGKTYSQTHPIMQHRKKKHPDEREVPVSQLLVSGDVS